MSCHLLLMTALIALTAGTILPVAASGADEPYRLGPGDILRVVVFDRPDLSGEPNVQDNGEIVLARAGRIIAANRTVPELEAALIKRMQTTIGLALPQVAVEVRQYRPFYVVGDIQTPGAYPYVPGMTVLHAITIGGGVRRRDPVDLSIHLEAGRLAERIAVSRFALGEALIRRARFVAESRKQEKFDIPPEVLSLMQDVDRASVLENERSILRQRRDGLQKQTELLRSQQLLLQSEITALEQRKAAKQREIASFRAEQGEVQVLEKKALVPRTRVYALDRQFATAEADERELEVQIVRAKRNVRQVDVEITVLENRQDVEIATELKRVDELAAVLRINLQHAASQLRDADRVSAIVEGLQASTKRAGDPLVMRRGAEGTDMTQLTVTYSTKIHPGDIVVLPVAGGPQSLPVATPSNR